MFLIINIDSHLSSTLLQYINGNRVLEIKQNCGCGVVNCVVN